MIMRAWIVFLEPDMLFTKLQVRMALLRRSRVCGHWLELPLRGPKAEAAKVWKELSVRSQYKFCSRLFPLLYIITIKSNIIIHIYNGPELEAPLVFHPPRTARERAATAAREAEIAAREAEREKKRTRLVS